MADMSLGPLFIIVTSSLFTMIGIIILYNVMTFFFTVSDTRDYINGESINNPFERQNRRNDDSMPPSLAEYANLALDETQDRQLKKNNQYYSWATLR